MGGFSERCVITMPSRLSCLIGSMHPIKLVVVDMKLMSIYLFGAWKFNDSNACMS